MDMRKKPIRTMIMLNRSQKSTPKVVLQASRNTYLYNMCHVRPYEGDGALTSSYVGDNALTGICALLMAANGCDAGVMDGGMMRPQGGGGTDHLAKVQQKSVQTDTHFLFTPSPFPTSAVTLPSYNAYSCEAPDAEGKDSFSFSETPGVLVTLSVTSTN